MNDAPWLNPEVLRLVALITQSHARAFGLPLVACQTKRNTLRLISQELFVADMPIIAHNLDADPRLTYANTAALTLWRRRWTEMIGIPSRLTAPLEQQKTRSQILNQAKQQDAITNYQGVRVDSKGRKFTIKNVRIWTIWNSQTEPVGQAATFNTWIYM